LILTAKELIKATKEFSSESKFKSWLYTLSTVLFLAATVTLTFAHLNIFIRLFLSILSGLLIGRTFVIYHDYQHGTILRKSRIAKIFMEIVGMYILAPPSVWKRTHNYHHKHNSKLFSASVGSYPIMTKEKYLNSTKLQRFSYLASRHPITIGLGYLTIFFYGMCVSSFISSPKRHYDSLITIILHFAAAFLLIWFFGWLTFLLVMIIPFTIAFALGAYLFYAQHNFPGVMFKQNAKWTYENAALASSSFMKMSRLMNWFTANIGYHHIHHINARIPFYRLPEAMKKVPELQHPKTTSLKIKDVIACFRLKIWDSEKEEMISLRKLRKAI